MRSLAALLACTLVITPVDAHATGPQPTDHEAAHLVADRPPDAARVDADLEVILHTRGTEYAQAHARLLSFIAVAVPAAIPLTTFASVRRKHRRPLRAHEVSLAGAGFRLRF